MRPNGPNPGGGFSLIELMVALAIGSIIATSMMFLFIRTQEANREQFKSTQQLENGRYALDVLFNDIRHAGFFGEFASLTTVPASLIDPCDTALIPATGTDITATSTNSIFAFHVQGYTTGTNLATTPTLPTECDTLIGGSLRPGSDVIVVRRLSTAPLFGVPQHTGGYSGSAVANVVYVQTNVDGMQVQKPSANITVGAIGVTDATADVSATVSGWKDANGAGAANAMTSKGVPHPTNITFRTWPASIRKLVTHVYFVSNDTVPTLMRAELGVGPAFSIVPIAEGIEFMKIRYGVDSTPSVGDAVEDSVVTTPTAVADWQNVVMVEINLVARNPQSTNGFTDDKTYELGATTFTPTGAAASFKRHTFRSKAYLNNIGGRREL